MGVRGHAPPGKFLKIVRFGEYFAKILKKNGKNIHFYKKNNRSCITAHTISRGIGAYSPDFLSIVQLGVFCSTFSVNFLLRPDWGLNPIRSGLFQTVNDPGGGALKAPPYDLENYCVNLHHIIHMNFTRCFWHDPIGIFQKFTILTILQRFQNKK